MLHGAAAPVAVAAGSFEVAVGVGLAALVAAEVVLVLRVTRTPARRAARSRPLGGLAVLGIGFSAASALTGAVLFFDWGLSHGGPALNGIGWPLVSLFTVALAASLAQLVSAMPTAGGPRDWAQALGGDSWAWWAGRLSLVGQVALVAVIDFAAAAFATALVFGPEQAELFGGFPPFAQIAVFAGFLATQALANQLRARALGLLAAFSVLYQAAVVVAIVVVFAAFASHGPATQPYALIPPHGLPVGSVPIAFVFALGLLQAIWTYAGFGVGAHVAAEAPDASRTAARGLFLAVAVWAGLGYALVWVLTWSVVDYEAVIGSSATGGAFVQLFLDHFSTTAASVALGAVVAAMWLGGLAVLASASRLSRGDRSPAPAGWAVAGVAFLAPLWTPAYPVVLSLAPIALYLSYAIPVFLHRRAGRRGEAPTGPWSLGRLSTPFQLAALAWTAVLAVEFLLPFRLLVPTILIPTPPWISGDMVDPFVFGLLLAALGVAFAFRRRASAR